MNKAYKAGMEMKYTGLSVSLCDRMKKEFLP